jgi:hypothetical protein
MPLRRLGAIGVAPDPAFGLSRGMFSHERGENAPPAREVVRSCWIAVRVLREQRQAPLEVLSRNTGLAEDAALTETRPEEPPLSGHAGRG